MIKKNCLVLACLGLSLTGLVVANDAIADSFTSTQITDTNSSNINPLINDSGDIAWLGNNPTDVFYYNVVNSHISDLSSGLSSPANGQRISNNGDVVWQGDGNIFLYNNFSNTTQQLTSYPALNANLSPDINSKGDVVWGKDGNVFLYNNATASTNAIGTNGADPRINAQGNVAFGDQTNTKIYLYQKGTSQLIDQAPIQANFPQIADNNLVVWQGLDPSRCSGNVCYDAGALYTYQDEKANYLARSHGSFDVSSNGHVVWTGFEPNGDVGVYAYDGLDQTLIATVTLNDTRPMINDKGDVVWEDLTNNDQNTNVFYYDSTDGVITQLTNYMTANYDALNPDLNDNGQIVWEGGNSDPQFQIFEANLNNPTNISNTVPEPATVFLFIIGLAAIFLRKFPRWRLAE